jgi:hypothetical protein
MGIDYHIRIITGYFVLSHDVQLVIPQQDVDDLVFDLPTWIKKNDIAD